MAVDRPHQLHFTALGNQQTRFLLGNRKTKSVQTGNPKTSFAQIAASFEIKQEFDWPTEFPSYDLQRVSKRMTRFQIIISNNENVLQLQNKLQTIK